MIPMRKLLLFLIAAGLALPGFADEGHHHEAPVAGDYGKVHFPTSCAPAVQPRFERAVAILHSFGYEKARTAFEEVAAADPQCAIAWWGVAMTHYHGLWEQLALPEGAAAVAKARAIAQANPKTSARERGYIEAIALIYDDPSTALAGREVAYEQAMAKLRAGYPDDAEAAIFYALALDVDAPKTDKTFANQRKARDILVPIFKQQPNHPGLAHYIIHVSDYPPLAAEALPAARRYAEIAPASPHAQHMPSHIFTRVGAWDEAIASNRASAASAERDQKTGRTNEAYNQRLHAMDYLEYAYLQQARYTEAREIVETLRKLREQQGLNPIGGYADAAIPARFAVERQEWAEAAALPEPAGMSATDAITWYAKGLGAARSVVPEQRAQGAPRVRAIVGKLAAIRDSLAQAGNQYWSMQVEIQRLQVLAWAEYVEQDVDAALQHARAAADLEDSTEKAPVTPGAILPARENLAQMMVLAGQGKAAMAELEKVLESAPNRLAPTSTLARLAAENNQPEKARQYQAKVNQLRHRAAEIKTVSAPK
jgi:hypothetical protein